MEEKEITTTTTSSSGKKATKKQNPSKISASPNSEWKIIYPIYLNSKKKVSEGRKIPLSKAIENPTFNEISDILRYLGYPTEVEPDKAYSRDYTERGRVKFKLRNEKGDLIKPEIQNSNFEFFLNLLF